MWEVACTILVTEVNNSLSQLRLGICGPFEVPQQYQINNSAVKHSLFPISTKYDSSSLATSVNAEAAAVSFASLYSLSCLTVMR